MEREPCEDYREVSADQGSVKLGLRGKGEFIRQIWTFFYIKVERNGIPWSVINKTARNF